MAESVRSAHEQALPRVRNICDLLVDGLRRHVPGTSAKTAQNWCSIGTPRVAYVQHTRKALNVFLRCAETDGDQLSSLLNRNLSLSLSVRNSFSSEWAGKTPYFLRITTTDDAAAAVPLLAFLTQQLPKRLGIMTMPSEDIAERWEGNRALIFVNSFERDPKSRAACIKLFGASCAVCGFEFGQTYGEIGSGFIHVHHLNPLSQIGKSHKVIPKTDLRPVCPNCHEMLHKRVPPFSIEELRSIRYRNT